MIKILIVIEEEDGIDFRAYSLQISSRSSNLSPQAELRLIETSEGQHAGNTVKRPHTGFQANYRNTMGQWGKTLEARQIFMN
jgi:hypothetical protein